MYSREALQEADLHIAPPQMPDSKSPTTGQPNATEY